MWYQSDFTYMKYCWKFGWIRVRIFFSFFAQQQRKFRIQRKQSYQIRLIWKSKQSCFRIKILKKYPLLNSAFCSWCFFTSVHINLGNVCYFYDDNIQHRSHYTVWILNSLSCALSQRIISLYLSIYSFFFLFSLL